MYHLDLAYQKLTTQNILITDKVKDLDMVMAMYNLLEYSNIYSMTSGCLQKYYRDEIDGGGDNTSQGISFEYKTKITGKPLEQNPRPPQQPQRRPNLDGCQPPLPSQPPRLPVSNLNVKITIPIKYLSNCQRYLELPLIDRDVELDLSWTKDRVLIKHHNSTTGLNVMIASTNFMSCSQFVYK